MSVAELRGVTKRYGDIVALRGVDLAVGRAELLGVLGPNGAGKTTAVKLLLGLLKPTGGEVAVFGQDPRFAESRRRVGAMLQVGRVPETLRVREHIELFSSYYPKPLPFSAVVEAAGLGGLEKRLFGELSGGQRQRVLFALAICGNPDLLFLDEPTAGLDPEARRGMWGHIRAFVAHGGSVLLTTHYLEEADALADRVVVINHGAIVAEGTPAEIKARTSAKKVRCWSRLEVGAIERIVGVNRVNSDGQRFEILTQSPEAVLRELMTRDPHLSDIEVSSSSLEEAFLALTNGEEKAMEVGR
ncbi:MAG TPA: ABC transporter ATP-binding protein [Bryobacteraceae bacterium]|nr:ABC transporter ATP-binding protein [Bryobacteraceae bacterium]